MHQSYRQPQQDPHNGQPQPAPKNVNQDPCYGKPQPVVPVVFVENTQPSTSNIQKKKT